MKETRAGDARRACLLAGLLLLGTLAGGARAAGRPYALRILPGGIELDRQAENGADPLLQSLGFEAWSAQGLAFRTEGVRAQTTGPAGTQVEFALDGPLAAQASVSALITPQAGSVRTRWTVRYSGAAVEWNAARTGFRLGYAQPLVGAATQPATEFVRPTGAKPYEVPGDTPYRDLEWQEREVSFARSRLVVATRWYDPDWIYGGQIGRAVFLPAALPKGAPAAASFEFALAPRPAAGPGIASPAGAADAAALAAGRALSLAVLCSQAGNLFAPGETARFALRVGNVSQAAQTGRLVWTVWDYNGRRQAGGAETVALAADATRQIAVAIPHVRRGMLFLDARLVVGGAEWLDRTTFGVLPAARPVHARPQSPFGLAGLICDPERYPDQKTPDQVLAAAHRIGVQWVRFGRPLVSAVGASPDEDRQAARWQALFARYGLSCHLQINPAPLAPVPADQWQAQVRATLARYKGLSSEIEFGNELNLAGLGPKDYVDRILRPVHDITREVLPGSKILSMGLGGVDKKWLDGFVAAGGPALVDGLSVHPGCQPRAPEYWKGYRGWVFRPQVQDTLAASQAAGGKEVWLSETYAPTAPERSQLDVRTAADYLARTYLVSLALGATRIEWYQFQDGVWFAQRPNPADAEYNYGLVYPDLSPKPGYVAFGVLAEQLEGARYGGRLDLGADDLYGLRFGQGAGRVDVLWSYREKHETDLDWWPPEQFKDKSRRPGEPWVNRWHQPVSVRLPATGPVTVTDIMGSAQSLRPQAGFVSLPLTGSPLYVRGLAALPTRPNLW